MAVIKPFKAYRSKAEFINDITCVPYDVINTEEARQLADGKEHSFLHVIRPEIDVDPSISIYDEEVYQKGKSNLELLLNSELMFQESEASHYIYQLEHDDHIQTGIFSCVSVEDYDKEIILKHELTRPDKENDRTRHIRTQQAHAEPVMMTFQDTADIKSIISETLAKNEPIYSFDADGVTHRVWRFDNPDVLTEAFSKIPNIYITDGHHRCKSASRVCEELGGDYLAEYAFFPAVLFPMDEMKILPYNRIVYKDSLEGQFISELGQSFEIHENAEASPSSKGDVSIYYSGKWYGLSLPESLSNDPVSKMDVSRLFEFILKPMLNIKDQRTDPNIYFVGGSRGTKELEKLVDQGIAEIGISMYPTSIEELKSVSDAGLLMPPKSTWFEPKVRSGILIHSF